MTSTQQCLGRELESANAAIHKAGALHTEPDGFRWVDMRRMPDGFDSYYSGLVSLAFACGVAR